MPLILRNTKDSALSFTEMDGNFTYLDDRLKLMLDSTGLRVDSSHILAVANVDSASISTIAKTAADSAHVKGIVNAAYIQSVQSTKDSSFITNIIDSDYIEARADRSIGNITTLNAENIRGISNISSPHTDSIKVFVVTVAAKDTSHRYEGLGSGSGYKIDGVFAPFMTLTPGRTYRFDTSDGSNSGHPIHFYFKSDKSTGEFTTGVTQNGQAGQPGSYTQIQVGDETPTVLHYQCYNHAYMGNSIHAGTRNLSGYNTDDLVEGTQNKYYTDLKVKNIIGAVDVHVVPDVDDQRDLGSSLRKFRDLYLSGSTLHLGSLQIKDSSGNLSVKDNSGNEIVVNNIVSFDSAKVTGIVDASYIQARQADLQRDSSFITNIIDSNYVAVRTGTALDSGTTIAIINATVNSGYVQSRQVTYGNTDVLAFVDSSYVSSRVDTYQNSDVIALVDSAYVNARADITTGTDSAAVIALIDTAHVQARQDKAFASLTGKPTTLAGYGITDGSTFSGQFSALTGKPTTIAGYGITDAFDGAYASLTGSPTNVSTFTNDAGYITSYTETSTLNDVAGRGASTATALTFTGGIQVTGGVITDSIGNSGLGFGKLVSASDIQLDAAGDINALNNKIINVGTPSSNLDATNKSYVDTTATNKGTSDLIVVRLGALQYTSTTETPIGLHTGASVMTAPNISYTINTDNITTDTAGHYRVDFGTTVYAYAGSSTRLEFKAQRISGGSPSDIARTATYELFDSAPTYEYHQFGISCHTYLAANDGVRVTVDQIGGGTNENYMSDFNISSSYPGSTTLTLTKVD